jgi:hypothetical protein
MDKKYQTRDGREVRIYATDGHPDEPVHGAFKDYSGQWNTSIWNLDGTCRFKKCVSGEQCVDLIEVKPRIKRTVYLNVYYDGTVLNYTKEDADLCAGPYRLACIKVEIDCEEGEGL